MVLNYCGAKCMGLLNSRIESNISFEPSTVSVSVALESMETVTKLESNLFRSLCIYRS